MTTLLMLTAFALALILTLLSAWLISNSLYYAVIALYAVGFAADVVGTYIDKATWDWKATTVNFLVFGFVFYFVTMQKTMKRRFYEIAPGDGFRSFLREANAYRGPMKALVLLPVALVVAAITLALFWDRIP